MAPASCSYQRYAPYGAALPFAAPPPKPFPGAAAAAPNPDPDGAEYAAKPEPPSVERAGAVEPNAGAGAPAPAAPKPGEGAVPPNTALCPVLPVPKPGDDWPNCCFVGVPNEVVPKAALGAVSELACGAGLAPNVACRAGLPPKPIDELVSGLAAEPNAGCAAPAPNAGCAAPAPNAG